MRRGRPAFTASAACHQQASNDCLEREARGRLGKANGAAHQGFTLSLTWIGRASIFFLNFSIFLSPVAQISVPKFSSWQKNCLFFSHFSMDVSVVLSASWPPFWMDCHEI